MTKFGMIWRFGSGVFKILEVALIKYKDDNIFSECNFHKKKNPVTAPLKCKPKDFEYKFCKSSKFPLKCKSNKSVNINFAKIFPLIVPLKN